MQREVFIGVFALVLIGAFAISPAFGVGRAWDGYLWVPNYEDNTVFKIDVDTHEVVVTIPVGIHPAGIAVGFDYVYVVCRRSSNLYRISRRTDTIHDAIDLSEGMEFPIGVAVDRHGYAFVVGREHFESSSSRTDPAYLVKVSPQGVTEAWTFLLRIDGDPEIQFERRIGIGLNNKGEGFVPWTCSLLADTGVILFETDDLSFTDHSITSNYYRGPGVGIDKYGNGWTAGCRGKANISVLNPSEGLRHFEIPDDIPKDWDMRRSDVLVDPGQAVWVGTTKGLIRLIPDTEHLDHFQVGVAGGGLALDRHGFIWAAFPDSNQLKKYNLSGNPVGQPVQLNGPPIGFGDMTGYECIYLPGDLDGDWVVGTSDLTFLISYLDHGGSPPVPLQSGDVNCDGEVATADVDYLEEHLLHGGSPPCDPDSLFCWDHDGDGYEDDSCNGEDCDDSDSAVYPGAEEICDGKDSDCDGTLPADEADGDGDGWPFCADCDDADPLKHPGASDPCDGEDQDCDGEDGTSEKCDGEDDDCDGIVPDDEIDGDGDGWMICEGDCDDSSPEFNPAVQEVCDAIDWDCSGDPHDRDFDGDGYIDSGPICMGDDCDDTDRQIHPGARELCDGKDNDCDGTIPDVELDLDDDGYVECVLWLGTEPGIYMGGDCDDADSDVNPSAMEEAIEYSTCFDGIDNDCDGLIDTDPECIAILVPDDQPTIQGAINVAEDWNTIIVAPGIYRENISFLGKDVKVRSMEGPYKTIVDGGRNGSVVTFAGREREKAVLDGFTLQNGSGTYATLPLPFGGISSYVGGGLFCSESSPTVTKCRITGNFAYMGGGVSCLESSPTIINCMISENWASGIGHGGGGFYLANSSPTITNCTFTENLARFYGGGLFCSESFPIITNSIFWNDYSMFDAEIHVRSGAPVVTYSDMKTGWPGEGNIDENPLFIRKDDYHLRLISPCIDAGTDIGIYIDIDGQTRPWGEGIDMGADEFSTEPCSVIASSGNQFAIFYLIPALALIFFSRRFLRR